ncbi:Uncharacterized membrane protein [Halanaerobium congolense]|jgi:uncharacterized membrane protein|uniref:Putative membrane protein n=1 Tax=Halanaerobium congolense TaxID=54121 RepID=A0A1G8M1N7_9FIRM|nr:DUF2177 family protein [Halanaerobium congolense]KXS49927.1 MAG: hypothetical protein AWL62_614 [Halanaerobium sp. T82-1]PUU90971.1 MAG: hypothetical protein CI948_1334 [Halanaerobium sp.]TDX41784.1 putative membrane protein [Halanaerobium congolense]SDI61848.1 Uncharacterized membrane protein [Halanaerobium congolense]SET34158.1 Uncharacterized membrane protein [Halanaerobium congolense]
MFYIKSYLIAIVVFFSVDLVWLGAVAKNLYREQLGFLLKDNFNMTAAAVFYIFYIAGLLFFVINRAVELSSWQYALGVGAFFGFITYATYDMTNLATIKDWPVMITVIDIIWGSVLCGLTSLITYLLINYFKI